MPEKQGTNWELIENNPKFRQLHHSKSRFLFGWMAFSVVFYFMLPIGAAYFQDIFRIKVFGALNIGILFAFSQFAVTWGIAYYYSQHAAKVFDQLTQDLVHSIKSE